MNSILSTLVTTSGRFLKMPATARLLYYDLAMSANGTPSAVDAFPIMRMTGASESDLELLAQNGFITILEDEYVTVETGVWNG